MKSYNENRTLTVINLFGGPGVGKSSIAARLFSDMKVHSKSVEYVSEVAKDYTWEERHNMLTEQDIIFAKQHSRIRRLVGKVDYVVVDSPIILGLMYIPKDFPSSFEPYVLETFNTYNNKNILLNRTVPYNPIGRNQSELEAKCIDAELKVFLTRNNINFEDVDVTPDLAEHLLLQFC